MRDEKTSHIPDEWLVPTVASEDAMADSLGSYRLCFEVAAGGMATVYLALYEGALGFEKIVALKKIHKHLARERQFVDMFFDEARIAAFIDHPFVCKVVDFGHAQDSYYLAMEYLVGEPLSEVWTQLDDRPEQAASPQLPKVVARVVADLCEGLHAAHELSEDGEPMGLVHRDITPANLFVLYDGTVRVVDFGIAKAKNRISHTETGHVKGKYAYVAPEQLKMKPLDRRCDVWGMGVVMWELLTTRRLFKRDNPVETIRAVTHEPIEPPSNYRPDIPEELDRIVLKALSRRPERRYRTAREMALALEQWLGSQSVTVPRAEVSEWLDALFPGAYDRKRQLIELTRHGESAIPIAEQEGLGEDRHTNVAIEAQTNVFPVSSPRRRMRPSRPEPPSEPTAEVTPDQIEEIVGETDEDEEPTDDLVVSEKERQPERPRAKVRIDEDEPSRPRGGRRKGARAGWLVAAAVVLGLGAVTAAVLGPGARGERDEGAAAEGAGSRGTAHDDGAGDDEAAPESADDLASLGEQADEVWPPWAGSGTGSGDTGETGEVYLTTRGGWADVYVEGRKVGRTPQELRLPTGRHTVVLRPWGGETERPLDVEVRAGRRAYLDVAVAPRPR